MHRACAPFRTDNAELGIYLHTVKPRVDALVRDSARIPLGHVGRKIAGLAAAAA
jgi:hypothetical protein